MDNQPTISSGKAGLIACLFLLSATALIAQNNSWLTSEKLKKAYDHCLNLNLNEARAMLRGEPQSPEALTILSFADATELLITEDQSLFDSFEEAYEERVGILRQTSPATEKSLIALAEIRLQWAFVFLKYGKEFTAAWNVRQSYLVAHECRKKFPASVPILKTTGVLEVMLGTIPEKYQWVLNLLGMKGSVDAGLEQLRKVEAENGPTAFESRLLLLLIDGFILQQTDSAVHGIEQLHYSYPDNRLLLFLGASLAIKNSMSEMAMNMLEKLKSMNRGLPVYYADYLLGEVYLHQGNHTKSIQVYQEFIKEYKGKNFIKDAYYKIGLCYWLTHRSEESMKYYDLARASGRESAEADKYAARALAEGSYPNIKLARARYSTDGGYYNEAFRTLMSVKQDELVTKKDQVEYAYRLARLYHKTDDLANARKYYLETIERAQLEPWYYAPNACLQLGYLYSADDQTEQAKRYFSKALSYKKHEYKNSIDSKAKSALSQLKK